MADDKTADLPEGTDTVIEGAANTARPRPNRRPLEDDGGDTLTIGEHGRPRAGSPTASAAAASNSPSQAGDKARGLVTQGLERTSEALANVSKMVGDTAAGHR